jgi:hypothetical protein
MLPLPRNRANARNGDGSIQFRAWQDRITDPMLTVLLALGLSADFIAEPLAARGLPLARAVADIFRR